MPDLKRERNYSRELLNKLIILILVLTTLTGSVISAGRQNMKKVLEDLVSSGGEGVLLLDSNSRQEILEKLMDEFGIPISILGDQYEVFVIINGTPFSLNQIMENDLVRGHCGFRLAQPNTEGNIQELVCDLLNLAALPVFNRKGFLGKEVKEIGIEVRTKNQSEDKNWLVGKKWLLKTME